MVAGNAAGARGPLGAAGPGVREIALTARRRHDLPVPARERGDPLAPRGPDLRDAVQRPPGRALPRGGRAARSWRRAPGSRCARPGCSARAALLDCSRRKPLLLVKRTLHSPGARDALFAELACRTDRLVFAQTLPGPRPHTAAGPAAAPANPMRSSA